MSTTPGPMPNPPIPPHHAHSPLPPAPPRVSLMGCAFALSFLGNVLAGVLILILCAGFLVSAGADSSAPSPLPEKHFAGPRSARDKVAIVTIDGPILEGFLEYVNKQLDQTGKDDSVKATVLRINSPGGSITASDALHRRILQLKAGDEDRQVHARPVVVSMSSIAASGGYYIAAPAARIFAERTTLTGSIGVYGSFPNLKGLASKLGVEVETIKAGQIKDAASFFRDVTPTERQVLQDMVDEAYVQFLEVVEQGRPALTRRKLLERFTVKPLQPDPEAQKGDAKPYTRYRADGGIFSATKAKELGLIDAVGSLEDAVQAAASAAKIETYRAVRYQKQKSLSDMLLGVTARPAPASAVGLDADAIRAALTPRLWYLAPGHEVSGILPASGNSTR